MLRSIIDLLTPAASPDVAQSLIVLMLAISLGVFIGRVKFKRVSLGVSAVMFTGLLLGHLGYALEENTLRFLREFGLVLFVYSLGVQAGPSFFSALKKEGLKFNVLSLATVALGGLMTYLLYVLTGQSIENSVGMMSGAVTNTPGLGAAKSVLVELQGHYSERTFSDPAIAYAITYPAGVLGVILMIVLLKRIFRIDIEAENKAYEEKFKNRTVLPVHRKCRVIKPEAIGKTIGEIHKLFGQGYVIFSRIKHSGSSHVFSPVDETVINERDVLMVVGLPDHVEKVLSYLGRESSDTMVEAEDEIQSRTLIVTRKDTVHKTLSELDLYNRYDLKATRVFRSGMELVASPNLELFFGDKIRVVGNKWSIEQAEKLIGNSEKKLMEPDFLSLFGGLILGVLVGSIPIFIPSFPVPVRLGFAAGPLLVALLLSRYGGIGMIHTYINHGAVMFMKDLGICLFFASVGIHAGHGFYENFVKFNGWTWIFFGSMITVIPLLFMVLTGRYIMKINFLQLVGLMSGTYTDPAALSFSNAYFKSEIPTLTYATVYPLVTIARILMAQLLILLLL
jgi:putative transport protein